MLLAALPPLGAAAAGDPLLDPAPGIVSAPPVPPAAAWPAVVPQFAWLPSFLPSTRVATAPGEEGWLLYPGYTFRFGIGSILSPSDRWIAENAGTARAVGEVAAGLGVTMGLYWVMSAVNAADWEVSWDAPSWRKKVVTFEAVTFDTNVIETNVVWHPVAGALYYTAGRANELAPEQSLLLTTAASTFWEYISEFREKVSINDLVLTPVGGLALGEPLHQLSVFFSRSAPGPLTGALASATSPLRVVEAALFERRTLRAASLDALGLPTDVWHRFVISAGVGGKVEGDGEMRAEARVALCAELASIPGYGRPGIAEVAVGPGATVMIGAQGSAAAGDMFEVGVTSKVMLAGYHWKALRGAPGALRGGTMLVGLATAFDYQMHDWSTGYRDKIGVVNVLGPSVDLGLYRGQLSVRLGADAYGDFAGVKTPVAQGYFAQRGKEGLRSVLARQGYYFAGGLTVRPRVSVGYGGLEALAESKVDVFRSIEGHDRFQERIKDDTPLEDHRAVHAAWIRYRRPAVIAYQPWIGVERLTRSGRLGELRVSNREIRYQAGVSLVF